MTSPATARLSRIHLEMALAKGKPADVTGEAYEFVAPLNASHHIDIEGWKAHRALCFVHRLEGGRVVERGLLVHRPGGAGGSTWVFDYEPGANADEEAGYRFAAHAFVAGEYVTLRDADGDMQTWRITSVKPA